MVAPMVAQMMSLLPSGAVVPGVLPGLTSLLNATNLVVDAIMRFPGVAKAGAGVWLSFTKCLLVN